VFSQFGEVDSPAMDVRSFSAETVAKLVCSEKHSSREGTMKILLIEDSKFQRIANERALVMSGYEVIHAGDGVEGLRVARENIPDLILLDMMLPKLSGLDVLRTLKIDALVKHIPVIVLTGLGQGNEGKLLNDGAAAFLLKTEKSLENNSRVLIQTVENVLARAKASV
jgi:DNA-binding response OmpR family regulator